MKKGATQRAAPLPAEFWKTAYFPFFGPFASSFFPFFFIAMLLSPAVPGAAVNRTSPVMTGAAHHAISLHIRAPRAAVKKIPSLNQKLRFYWLTPPV
jgi:hypothetical protein